MAQTTARRRLTARELGIWRDFIEVAEALRTRLESRLQAESDLSSGDYRVLVALSTADGRRLRSSDLAARIGWERSRLSHHLGRMEQRGLIRRNACVEDCRGAEVALTDAGTDALRRGSIPHFRAIRELFVDALDTHELDQLATTTRALRIHLGLDPPARVGERRHDAGD